MGEWKQEIQRILARLDLEPAREAEIVEELAQHLEDRYSELLAAGATDQEARRLALAEINEHQALKRELMRVEQRVGPEPIVLGTTRRSHVIADLAQDLRYGMRTLIRKPGFTLIVVATLALGIGVNTALFTGFNLILRPKPVKDPDSIVGIRSEIGGSNQSFSYSQYLYYRDNTKTLSDILPTFSERFLLGEKTPGTEPEEIAGTFVTDDYLSALGGTIHAGRFFDAAENSVPGRDLVIVLSHRFWERRFGGNPAIVGQAVLLDGQPVTVIGVAESKFVGVQPEVPDIWLPLMMRQAMATVHFEDYKAEERSWFGSGDFRWLTLHGRLLPGKAPADVEAEFELFRSQLPRSTKFATDQETITVEPYSGRALGRAAFRNTMGLVLGASGLVLLIACSNIANMLLARTTARRREIGVRLALGASRSRLLRQLITESFLLAGMGGAAGVALAWWSVETFLPTLAVRSDGVSLANTALSLAPDWRVLGFAMLLTLVSGLVSGLAPALGATRTNLIDVIKDDCATSGGRVARSWLRSGLVVAQIAFCLALLIPAGLLLRALTAVLSSDRGYASEQLLSVTYSLELSGYDLPRARAFQEQLLARLASLPGVQSVSPERDFGGRVTVTMLEEQGPTGLQFDQVPFQWVTAGYIETIGTPMAQGRGFTDDEVLGKAPVVIVSESAARTFWPGENPLGKTLRVERRMRDGNIQLIMGSAHVIGVARDNQIYRPGQIPPSFFYAPQPATVDMDDAVLVRTALDAASLREQVRREAYSLEPVLRLWVRTMDERFSEDSRIREARTGSTLGALLGGLALLLAAVGIYGVMAFTVAQRTREIGIRIALGAQAGRVQMLVVKQALAVLLAGAVIGAPIALLLTRVISSMLFGLSAIDPVTYSSVVILLALVALAACWIPARRASRVDPMVALRYE
ncbi:MAG TPA: ABC transporter permease [Blastocatellia bacterium]|nr:ABC transporter permease [Blastocatellia bacterium]